jgi:hypothetical protein
MSFEARRLRVQLPDGQTVAFVEPDAAQHLGPPGPPDAQKIVEGACLDPLSVNYGSCLDKFTRYLLVKGAPLASLNAEHLPALREHLEAQLKEIDDAQRASKEAG